MFILKEEWGNHKIFKYDNSKYNFTIFFQNLYNEINLENLHMKSNDFIIMSNNTDSLNEIDTDLHKIFYNEIKTNNIFKKLYCDFIKDIYKNMFPDEKYIIYQSYPSIRIQYSNSIAIPPHKDSDYLSNHPLYEKNFIIPITEMKNTNSIYIESEEDKKDFKSITLNPSELFYFNGNTCTHYNEKNQENKLRISLDFRIILLKDYINYITYNNPKITNPRDIMRNRNPTLMIIGKYYQCCAINESIDDMMEWYSISNIMQHRPTFEKEEADACYQYMSEDNFITEFKKTTELENMISKYLNIKHCIMTTSGTCAIILALMSLMSLNLKEGDEVIVPNYTMIATINAVKMLKLKPIIIDIDKDTFTINSNEIEKNITEKTKCVLHVSLNNRYNNIDEIVELCKKKNIILLEDSAQSLGCKINGKSIGTFGKIGCFSLSTPKIISTGQGGFCVTDDDELANKIRMIKNFGRKESGEDNFEIFGINLKFTDLQAVIGIEQMKKMDYRVKRMREIYDLYFDNLKNIVIMRKPLSDEWIPWFVDIFTDKKNELSEFLKKHKIGTRHVYGEINKTNMYYDNTIFNNSNYVDKHGLFLPSYITLSNNDITHICKIITLFFTKS